ncbi:hypothetical protein ABK040_014917 [Willaertia magna]
MPRPTNAAPKQTPALVKLYLFIYNIALTGGWGYILYLTILHHLNGKNPRDLYSVIEKPLQLFQTLAVLEIVHSLIGFVRSPVFTTLMQVFSRLFVVWFSLYLEHQVKYTEFQSIFITTLMFAWCTTEVIRYSFYALKLYDICPYFLTWLRYSTFIVLYPLGVSSEIALTVFRLSYVKEFRPFSVDMPNAANMSFDSYSFVWLILLSYAPGFYQLYTYMFVQRKKTLSAEKEKAQ